MSDTTSQKHIAHILGVTTREVYNLRQKGLPTRADGGRLVYPIGECVQWYVRYRESLAQREKPTDIDEAQRRKAVGDARLVELKVEEMERRLIPIEIHEQRFQRRCEQLAARLKGLGRYVGDVQRAMTDIEAAELLHRISDELHRACMGAADDDLEEGDDDGDVDGAA